MTELIWDGKYIDGKRHKPVKVALPFQTIETVNESAADRRRTLELFSNGTKTEWRNRLIWGDKKYVLPSLLPEFAGKVNLIYIDPPFDTGADFSFTATLGAHPDSDEDDTLSFTKEPSIIEQKAYRDTWGHGLDSYIHWFYETAILLHELLSDTGTLYVHLDWHIGHYAKAILDEVFGADSFSNEVVWRRTNVHNSANAFGQVHDVIFRYVKGDGATFNLLRTPYAKAYVENRFTRKDDRGYYDSGDLTGPGIRTGDSGKEWFGFNPTKIGRHWQPPKSLYEQMGEDITHLSLLKRLDYLHEKGFVIPPAEPGMAPRAKVYVGQGLPVQDVWAYQPHTKGLLTDGSEIDADVAWLPAGHPERLAYDTQKPEGLLSRIIKVSSNPGDLVMDCFCGSGTTAAVAEKLNRRWITCDLGRFAIHTARKRLLSIPGVKPFRVENLGKYERQAWQAAEFTAFPSDQIEQQRSREAAYRDFILDLYHASPLAGHSWLHGVKSGRMVHVGAVDAPVTLSDIRAIAREVWKASNGSGEGRKAAADILGWEFAFELNETARQIAAESRVDVAFKKIPREVLEKKAVEQGDIKFFELGALSVDAKLKKQELQIELKEFVIPIDDVPEEARKAIKHWAQMIDYWAVDWDFKDDTFHNQWQSYRTRQDPKLELKAKFEYLEPGDYKVMVKVIDILGNDTTKTLDIKVK